MLPRSSFNTKGGKTIMSIRVPLDKGWMQFFQAAKQPRRVLPGGQRHSNRVMYQVAFMAEGDKVLQAHTRNQQCVQTADGKTMGATSKPLPDFLGHGTSLADGLAALKSGVLPPGSGSCGAGGIHGFRINAADDQSLLDATALTWDLAAAAGRTHNCMFVLACNGCLINGNYRLEIPPGSVAVKEWTGSFAEYAAHPTSVDVVAVMFELEDLTQQLFAEMQAADPEYTKELHSSLMACQEWLCSNHGDEQVQMVKLANAVTLSGGREVQEAQKLVRAKEANAKLADNQRKWKQQQESWQSKGAAEERKRLQEEHRQEQSTSSQQPGRDEAEAQQSQWQARAPQWTAQEWPEQQHGQQQWWTWAPQWTAQDRQWQWEQQPHEQAREQPLRQPSTLGQQSQAPQLQQQPEEVQTRSHDELMNTLREKAKKRKENQLFQ